MKAKMKSFPAQYPGKCHECQDPIDPGEQICRWGSHWAHAECCNILLEKDLGDRSFHKSGHKTSTYRRGKGPGSYG